MRQKLQQPNRVLQAHRLRQSLPRHPVRLAPRHHAHPQPAALHRAPVHRVHPAAGAVRRVRQEHQATRRVPMDRVPPVQVPRVLIHHKIPVRRNNAPAADSVLRAEEIVHPKQAIVRLRQGIALHRQATVHRLQAIAHRPAIARRCKEIVRKVEIVLRPAVRVPCTAARAHLPEERAR